MLNNPKARRVTTAVLEGPAKALLRMHVSPDAVTIVGTVLAVATSLICFSTGRFILGPLLITLFAFSDLLDGTMARLRGTSGPWGNFLDATLDRVADGAMLAGIAIWAGLNDQPWTLAGSLLVLVMGQVTSYAKARAEAVGATANVGIAERAERIIVILLAVFITGFGVPYVLPIALWILGVLGFVTVIQRIVVVRRQLRP